MVHYHVSGKLDHPCVVFLHGFLGDFHDWSTTVAELSQHLCCIGIDLPGHGLSTDVPPTDFDGAADAVVEVLDDAGVAAASIAGYSMGGRIALYTVLRHPHRFKALVLESATPGIMQDSERRMRHKRDVEMADELEAGTISEFLRWWYSQPMFASLANRPDLLGSVLVRRAQQNPRALAAALRAFSTGNQPPLWERLKEIQIPVLVIAGDDDPKYTLIARTLYGRLLEHDREDPEARLHASEGHRLRIIPGCGHNVHLENPEVFADAVLHFTQTTTA